MTKPSGFFETVFRNFGIPCIVLDAQGMPAGWNDSFAGIFFRIAGFPAENLDIPLFDFWKENESFQLTYWFSELMSGKQKTATLESPLRSKNGVNFWFKAFLSAFSAEREGISGTYILCVLEDITEQKSREKQLLTAKEEAEKATTTKSQFLANMSHEIRTPIQTISGMTELLAETKLDTEQQEYSRQISFSTEILLSLVNDILDFSKIEAGKLTLELIDFDVRKCIEQSVDMITLEAHRKGLEVIVGINKNTPIVMHGDPSRFRQIILNLSKNAVKFTRQGEIEVSVFKVPREDEGEFLRIEIRDTGIGMPPAIREKLFTQFYQGDSSTTRRYGGTGLGLAISRALVEMMQGTIGARSNDGPGTTFFLEVPVIRPIYEQPDPAAPILKTGTILVVDDNECSRNLLVSLLESEGIAASGAESGAEALRMLKEAKHEGKTFSVILVDQFLKDMDGWHLGAEITQDKSINDVKLILMSPEGMIGAEAKMKLLAWFNGYVNKPVKRKKLLEAVAFATKENVDFDSVDEAVDIDPEPEENPVHSLIQNAVVLVAEDHPVNRELIKVLLERIGVRVELAEDGQEATEMAARREYDLLFMDIMMPRVNGYEAARIIRGKGYQGPIVAVTASALKGERERCIEAGMNDILMKPFKKNDIAMMVDYWIARKEKPFSKIDPEPLVPEHSDAWDKDVFDFSVAIETFLGKKEIVIELLGKFIKKTETGIETLKAAIVSGDTEKIRFEAHAIKGSSWNLQAKSLGNAALALETSAKNPDRETMTASFPGELETLEKAFRTFIACTDFYRNLESKK